MKMSNIPPSVLSKVGRNIHKLSPLSIILHRIKNTFSDFDYYDDIPPIVTKYENFTSLLIPDDHSSLSKK